MGLTLPQQFTNAQALQGQLAGLPAPQIGPIDLNGGGGPPAIPAPSLMPAAQPNQVLTDQDALTASRNKPAGGAQIHNPFLRGLARTADVIGSVFEPGLTAAIPGTTLHHNMLVGQAQQNLNNDQAVAEKQAQTANLNAQPQLKAQAAALNQDKLTEKTEHDQATVDATNARQAEQHRLNLVKNGQKEVTDPDGTISTVDDPDSPIYQQRKAVTDYNTARKSVADAMTDYKKAQTANLPEQMQQAQERIDTARANQSTAAHRLGLSEQEFGFNQDKFYNPQPTANERKSGDLAESAVNQVHTMRSILAAHPEFAGPGGEAKQAFTRWISSNGEDAGKFLAARDYLAEHSAGVFGGRGAYIIQQLNGLTSGNFSHSTLNGVLDQAESTAGHFVQKGAVHGKPGAGGGSNPVDPLGIR